MNIFDYNYIIFDFDGVIADSNLEKTRNITEVADRHCDGELKDNFLDHFTNNHGVPRETKIFKYFDQEVGNKILQEYNALNKERLLDVPLTDGFMELILALNNDNKNCYVVSGGDQQETRELFDHWGIAHHFIDILGGPKSKIENIEPLHLEGKVVFIGDSKKDYETAQHFNFDFIFMYGYTQFHEWESFFNTKEVSSKIKNLSSLILERT